MILNPLTPQCGKVYLIGAGPGDPELLTFKAAKAIARATVLMVDDLVNPAILKHAQPEVRTLYVGKRGGCASTPQSSIESMMLQEALAGEIVARIKGGDPYIFGRGGEELATLRAAGIECEVINGITSGLAAATQMNVPLTHRSYTQGVIFVTGHGQATSDSNSSTASVNWQALAASRMTLVIYMGMIHAAYIQQQLLNGGLPADTPAVVVQNASGGSGAGLSKQCFMTLGNLSDTIVQNGLKSPSIMIIGDVVHCGLTHFNHLNI
ncbi:MAG: uroporphyrinogen-III C-methyltransferase [Pseudomonadota bacterium]|jgi:uroporphyrin-III C-methyltransferase